MSSLVSRTVVRLKDFRARDVGGRVSNVVGSLADQFVSGTNGFVRSSPWRAAGAVAVAGIAAGILVSRSRARRRATDEANSAPSSEVLGG
jgi:ElaB/YqjD/DUF883 family membrane-anchored ribosome-binding protein